MGIKLNRNINETKTSFLLQSGNRKDKIGFKDFL